MSTNYVHGYNDRESLRLNAQADSLSELLHRDSLFPAGSLILEAGCGVGAQTKIIAAANPSSRFLSIDISNDSLRRARECIDAAGISNVDFRQGDIFDLPFPEGYFDHVFICFVLEHLTNPVSALEALYKVVRKGGTVTVIEGDHGSAYYHPESSRARKVIDTQIRLQASNGGNALIGRQLYPLLVSAGFTGCTVSPRMVYVDASLPHFVEGFTRNTFTAMMEGIREKAISSGMIDEAEFDKGIRDLYRTAEPDGVFCYTFFRGTGCRPA